MEMHVINNLMRNATIVLQDVVVLDVLRNGDFLCYSEDLRELVVGNVVEFCAVVLRDDELVGCLACDLGRRGDAPTEWPLERGPISRNAKVLSLSNIFIEGISPRSRQQWLQ
jgi:hypothetical protein